MNYVELINSLADLKSSELFELLDEAVEQYARRIGEYELIIVYNQGYDIDVFTK